MIRKVSAIIQYIYRDNNFKDVQRFEIYYIENNQKYPMYKMRGEIFL